MFNFPLDIRDTPAGISLVPGAIQFFGGSPELHDEVAGQIRWLGLTPFLPPQADQGGFIAAHDDPGIGSAYEASSTPINRRIFHFAPHRNMSICDIST